jgi:hypothetical protein
MLDKCFKHASGLLYKPYDQGLYVLMHCEYIVK